MDIAIDVRTPRLSMRAMKEEDAKDVLEILSDKETAELGGMNPISSLDAALDYVWRSIRNTSSSSWMLQSIPIAWDITPRRAIGERDI